MVPSYPSWAWDCLLTLEDVDFRRGSHRRRKGKRMHWDHMFFFGDRRMTYQGMPVHMGGGSEFRIEHFLHPFAHFGYEAGPNLHDSMPHLGASMTLAKRWHTVDFPLAKVESGGLGATKHRAFNQPTNQPTDRERSQTQV